MEEMLHLNELVTDFASAFKVIDTAAPRGRSKKREYQPGIGPLNENEAVRLATAWLKEAKPDIYNGAGPRAYPGSRQLCDLVVPTQWAIEFKLIRPFGDNGVEAEHWSENILHPYAGDVSSIGDALKLADSSFEERRAVVVYGFEHLPPVIDLETAVKCFELTCAEVLRIHLSPRSFCEFAGLMHPCHQHGKVFGWEVMGRRES